MFNMSCKKGYNRGGKVAMTTPFGMKKKHPDMESAQDEMMDTGPESKEKSKPKGFKPARGGKHGC